MSAPRPYNLIAELTYRCPLRCAYCSNPVAFREVPDALDTAAWCRVFREAAALGVVHVGLTGGEPTLRADLAELVRGAAEAGLYTHLVTAGTTLSADGLARLRAAGLRSVQLSVQDAEAAASDAVAGVPAFERKLAFAAWVRAEGLPLTLNVVLHRRNLARVPRDRRARARARRRPPRARERAVPRLGAREPRRAAALARAARRGRAGRRPRRAARRRAPRSSSCCRTISPGARSPAWAAGGGACSSSRPTAACCRATRPRRFPGSSSGTSQSQLAGGVLGRRARHERLPRRGLDARAVPQLPRARARLRRLPLPGLPAHGRRRGDRPGLRARAAPRADPRGAACGAIAPGEPRLVLRGEVRPGEAALSRSRTPDTAGSRRAGGSARRCVASRSRRAAGPRARAAGCAAAPAPAGRPRR